MNRTARVVASGNHSVTLQLMQSANCVSCPINCNEPLIDLFGLHNKQFTLSFDDEQYQLVDQHQTLKNPDIIDQAIQLEINTQDVMWSSAWLYMWPLACGVLGLTLGYFLGTLYNLSDVLALIGLFLGLFLNRQIKHLIPNKKHLKFRPKVTILKIVGT